jgi:5-methylcytosine-specific restriction enzyme subunit McrC
MSKTFYISEYGTIRSKQDFGNIQSNLSELYLNQEIFNDVYQSIIELQESNIETERPFVLFTKRGRHQIRVKNFVGILESRKGHQIEILPKIFSDSQNFGVTETRNVFLNMLKRLKNSPFINLNEANLKRQSNYPILEVFIKSFIDEGLKIFKEGLKSNYLDYQENTNFLKGKLMISDHIKQNMFNKTRFNCKFNIYSVDITENRIIKRTLLKLKKVSRSHKNLSLINSLLVHFDQVKSSTNIQKDLDLINNNNRLFSNYNRILSWSKVFLTDSSFTNFSGDNRNLAILFPMEKIFEDYIGYLFKKYSNGIQIKLQDQSYFLVENHKGTSKFRLKPDIVTSSSEDSKIVIDTKWKLINQFAERSNYFIKQPDMYQLYAYGKKYTDETSPLLILLYPKNENFTHMIEPFDYEGNLKLFVVPFDLSGDEIYHASQIKNLLVSDKKLI